MLREEPYKIVVSGYININVVDGSAFFLAGLTSLLATQPFVEIMLVSAVPIERKLILDEVMGLPNVTLVDPFSDSYLGLNRKFIGQRKMSRTEYAETLLAVCKNWNPDTVIIRDTETGAKFCAAAPKWAPRTAIYVTGLAHYGQTTPQALTEQLSDIDSSGARFLCQTESIQNEMWKIVENLEHERCYVLRPSVPDSPGNFEELWREPESTTRFVYAGKFFPDWNVDGMLASFKALLGKNTIDARINIVGDQFRNTSDEPRHADIVRYLLDTTPSLSYFGGRTRRETREVISASDVGLSWRRPALDSSTELSSKVLEYGSLAKPVVLNRTAAHIELLGDDYPLFANSMTEFKELVRSVCDGRIDLRAAAQACFNVAQRHTYSSVCSGLLEFLILPELDSKGSVFLIDGNVTNKLEGEDLQLPVDAVIRGNLLYTTRNPDSDFSLVSAAAYVDAKFKVQAKLLSGQVAGSDGSDSPIPITPRMEEFESLKAERDRLSNDLMRIRKQASSLRKIRNRIESVPGGNCLSTIGRKVVKWALS